MVNGAPLCRMKPISTILGNYLVEKAGWNEYLVTALNMIANFVTEFLFDRFVVFRGSIDTNDIARKKAEAENNAE